MRWEIRITVVLVVGIVVQLFYMREDFDARLGQIQFVTNRLNEERIARFLQRDKVVAEAKKFPRVELKYLEKLPEPTPYNAYQRDLQAANPDSYDVVYSSTTDSAPSRRK